MKKIMNTTQIFESRSHYLKREDKDINGVDAEFAAAHPNFAEDNETNQGCWNCLRCERCNACSHCSFCFDSERCTDCHCKANLRGGYGLNGCAPKTIIISDASRTVSDLPPGWPFCGPRAVSPGGAK